MEASTQTVVRNTVRAPGAPFARSRVADNKKVAISRESNALRASVLDIAMEIGLGVNGAVTDWLYNCPINEEEEEHVSCPSLTTASSDACSSTSSSRFPYSPSASSRSISSSTKSRTSSQKPFSLSAFSIPEGPPSIAETDTERLSATPTPSVATSITFSDSPMKLPPLSVRIPTKLKKRRTDGYESESGYVSDAKDKKKDKKGKVSKTGGSSESSASDDKARAKEEKEFAKRQKEAARQSVKSLSKKNPKVADSLASKGYETDTPTRKGFGRKKSGDAGYETDAGYLSAGSRASGLKKAKTKFFSLGVKSSKPDLAADVPKAAAQAAPSIPLPLPIAQKFSTTHKNDEVESLPIIPPLPSLHTDLMSTVPAQNSPPSNGPSVASLSPATLTDPVGRVKSINSKKDSLSETGVRDSQLSGESSGSSVSNASTGFSQESRLSRLKGFRFLSPSKSSSTPPNKFPTISLPLTRATSPPPIDTASSDGNQSQNLAVSPSSDIMLSPKLYPITRRSAMQEIRGRSPVPLASPAFLSPTTLQRSVSASPNPPSPSATVSTAASAPVSPLVSRTPSLRPQSNLTVSTINSLSPVSQNRFSRGRSPSPIPSSEWIVPSPSAASMTQATFANTTTLPVPNMYSIYDIPPPSPPPNTPLPKVPVVAENDVEDDPFGVNGTSVIRSLDQPERGKGLSFLARYRSHSGSNNHMKSNERSPVPTIRRISEQPIATPPSVISDSSSERQLDGSTGEELDDDAFGDQELQDILDRFIAEFTGGGDKHEVTGMALGRRKSSEALRNDEPTYSETISIEGEDNVELQDSSDPSCRRRSTVYYSDMEEDDGADPRLSRWSGSVYSRASFMDPQKSEETRARFVKRVEAMLDEAGIERGNKQDWDAVPPVPKLPEALAQSNLLTRQNQLKDGSTYNANGRI